MKDAVGKVVKIISHLLTELPAQYKYKIIFMERDLDEVLMSQQKMLVRDGKAKEGTINLKLVNAFKQNLERIKNWAPKQQHVEIVYVSHKNMINNPMEELRKVRDFLGADLNIDEMAKVVDKSLHREKVH